MTSRNKILVIGPDNGCVLEFVRGNPSELEKDMERRLTMLFL